MEVDFRYGGGEVKGILVRGGERKVALEDLKPVGITGDLCI